MPQVFTGKERDRTGSNWPTGPHIPELRQSEPAPPDPTGEAKLIKQFRSIVPHAEAEHVGFPGGSGQFAPIQQTQHGFQAASLSASLPALEASEPVIAAIVGVVLLHEHLNGRTAFDNAAIGASIVALLASVITLANIAGHDATDLDSGAEPPTTTDNAVTRKVAIEGRDRYRPRWHERSTRPGSRTNR